MGRLRRAVGISIALAVTLAASGSAQAATYTVDSTTDIAGIANCMPAVPNDCPLRGAVQNSRNNPVADEIVLTVNPQLFINGTDENLNVSDDIDYDANVGGPLTIRSDTGVRTISRQLAANNFRILDLSGGANTVTLEDVEIKDGNSTTVGSLGGGGIRFTGFSATSVLKLDNVYLHDNAVGSGANPARGGGLAVTGNGNAEVEVIGSRIEANRAAEGIAGSQGFGGGISVDGGVDLTVSGSTIRNNRAGSAAGPTEAHGGGVSMVNNQAFTAELTITDSIIDQNRAAGLGSTAILTSGGGIHAESGAAGATVDISISGGSVTGNTTGGGSGNSQGVGGGVNVFVGSTAPGGELTLDGVAVTGNRAGGADGATNPTGRHTAGHRGRYPHERGHDDHRWQRLGQSRRRLRGWARHGNRGERRRRQHGESHGERSGPGDQRHHPQRQPRR